MKIYVTHASSFDYRKELYLPLRNSQLNQQHEIKLPHEFSNDQFNSGEYMKYCDAILAEVSYPSTGQGIELGFASVMGLPIICFYKKNTKPSASLKVITDRFYEYGNEKDLIDKIEISLKELS